MTTSGSKDWTETLDAIVTDAYELVTGQQRGQTIPGEHLVKGRNDLNSIVKAMQSDGVYLWTREWVTKTLTASSEVTGTDGNIYTCIRSHTSANSNKPITGADWTTYWKLAGSTGGVWGAGTAYTSISDFTCETDTIDIEKMFVREVDGTDTPIELVTMSKYMDIWDKSNTGKPYIAVLDKQLTPKVYLYYTPDLTTYVIHYLRIRKLEDFDESNNTGDFPERWILPLTYMLAYKMSFKFGMHLNDRMNIKAEAEQLFKRARGKEAESTDCDFIEGAY